MDIKEIFPEVIEESPEVVAWMNRLDVADAIVLALAQGHLIPRGFGIVDRISGLRPGERVETVLGLFEHVDSESSRPAEVIGA